MKVYLETLGCRLNESEIEQMARAFRHLGHEIVPASQEAELCVINTCAVTTEAGRRSRKLIYQTHRQAPDASIVVTGCYSEIEADLVRSIPGVANVIPNARKDRLVQDILGLDTQVFDQEPLAREARPGEFRTRAFVKIQDGCNNRCTFCVTQIARGAEKSRPLQEILDEIRGLVSVGYQEIVLTGVHLGAYGRDWKEKDTDLKTLLSAILADTPIPRVRLSSLEPWDLPDDFFSLWRDRRMCRHLHLPLQAGCDQTLKRMARRTRKASFQALLEDARSKIPDLGVSTDMIVGFPGETDDEFAETKAFVEAMDFCQIHVFRFSPRPGTKAATMPDPVDAEVKAGRSAILQEISNAGRLRFSTHLLGTTSDVLWEQPVEEGRDLWQGLTDNYVKVRTLSKRSLKNHVLPVRLQALGEDASLFGDLLEPSFETDGKGS